MRSPLRGIEDGYQRVRVPGMFPGSLNLDPIDVPEIFLNSVMLRTLSLGCGMTPDGLRVQEYTLGGAAHVAVVGSGRTTYERASGTAADAFDGTNLLNVSSPASGWDVLIETNDAIVQWRNPSDTGWQGDVILPVGYFSIDLSSVGIRIKNRSAGNNAAYQIVAWLGG